MVYEAFLHQMTAITLPAALRLPLATNGVIVTLIPCRHRSNRVHIECEIVDCRIFPYAISIEQSRVLRGAYIRFFRRRFT